jgi:hypothetical protein
VRYKLGKKDPKWSPKILRFGDFIQLDQTPLVPPEKTYLEYKIPPDQIGMFGNDTMSDCLAAYWAHHLMLITAHTAKPFVPEVADVVKLYSAFTGYDPRQTDSDGNNPTDNGGTFTDLYNYLQTTGFCGRKILGWVSINPANRLHRQLATWLFLGCGVGIQCPSNAQDQFAAKQPFEAVDNDGGPAGGHAIFESGDGALGHNYETWGFGAQKGSNAWDRKYVDEVYAVLTDDVIERATGLARSVLNVDKLLGVLKGMAA